jgi:glycosyltransferase involved in cell wall biosynthesis
MARVSVVIPCYNQGAFLDEAVDSVLGQTFEDFEIIIVNDGSTDEATVRLLSGYGRPRTRVIHSENRGLASARNLGIKVASGEYILPLDADDRIGPRYLEQGVAVLDREPGIGIVYCWGELFGDRTGVIKSPSFSRWGMLVSNLIFCSAMFRRSGWERSGGYNPAMIHGCEDWDFWLSLLELGFAAVRLPEVSFFYRVRESSMNQAMDDGRRFDMFRRMIANHPRLYRGWRGPLARSCFRLLQSRLYRYIKGFR